MVSQAIWSKLKVLLTTGNTAVESIHAACQHGHMKSLALPPSYAHAHTAYPGVELHSLP